MKKQRIFLFFTIVCLGLLLLVPSNKAAYSWDILAYDDGAADQYLTPVQNDSVAVRFSPPTDIFKISGMILYLNSSNLANVRVWILNSSMNIIMDPYIPSIIFGLPPYHIDFGDLGPIMLPNNVSAFYIVIQWMSAGAPDIGVDTSTHAGQSYRNISGTWQSYSVGNIMIRAQFEDINPPAFDHVPLQFAIAGESISLSMEVDDEFGVDSVTLYYRNSGSNSSFAPVSLALSGGTAKAGIWYGSIPSVNVTLLGLEYYLWATDLGGNSRYYRNATLPYTITVLEAVPEIPVYIGIIAIVILSVAALVLVFILPKYEGEDTK
jgi:hypothetical protein